MTTENGFHMTSVYENWQNGIMSKIFGMNAVRPYFKIWIHLQHLFLNSFLLKERGCGSGLLLQHIFHLNEKLIKPLTIINKTNFRLKLPTPSHVYGRIKYTENFWMIQVSFWFSSKDFLCKKQNVFLLFLFLSFFPNLHFLSAHIQGRNRHIFLRGQSHFSWFFPRCEMLFPSRKFPFW